MFTSYGREESALALVGYLKEIQFFGDENVNYLTSPLLQCFANAESFWTRLAIRCSRLGMAIEFIASK